MKSPNNEAPPYGNPKAFAASLNEKECVGVPKKSSKPTSFPYLAMGRNEKIPPPSLLTTTVVRGGECEDEDGEFDCCKVEEEDVRARVWNAFRSCRPAKSPTTRVVGYSEESAYPAADDMIPSIPLAPLFTATEEGLPDPIELG